MSRQKFQPMQRTRQSIGGIAPITANLWPLRSYLELGALSTAVPCARLHTRHLLWEWGLDGLADNTELLVSELVTNAVQAMTGHGDYTAVRLGLFGDKERVRIEVWDGNPQTPALGILQGGLPALEDENGRGLFLVAMLSARWDSYPTQDPRGKIVWCELDAQKPEHFGSRFNSQSALPRRIPHTQPKQPVKIVDDLDILRRLRNGLRELDNLCKKGV